jgi:hypothetical protein
VRSPFGQQATQGNDGAQGPAGEVTNMDLSTALGGTSANSNGVAQLGLTVSDPPTQSELQAVANKLDELIAALRR